MTLYLLVKGVSFPFIFLRVSFMTSTLSELPTISDELFSYDVSASNFNSQKTGPIRPNDMNHDRSWKFSISNP